MSVHILDDGRPQAPRSSGGRVVLQHCVHFMCTIVFLTAKALLTDQA